MQEKAAHVVEAAWFQRFIMAVIVINAITIGIQTMALPPSIAMALTAFDALCLAIYIVEAILKLTAYRSAYFRDPWNDFDFIIVVLCLVPASLLPIPVQIARVLRVFRAFRVLRLISAFRQLRIIVEAVGKSIPGVCWTALLLGIVYYVFAVVGTSLFGERFPEWFGNLGASFYTLFQVMTLESWSMGISRPVMEVFPWAWAYFVPFVVVSAFIIVNVVVGIIVGTIDETQKSAQAEDRELSNSTLFLEFAKLQEHMANMEALVNLYEKERIERSAVEASSAHTRHLGASHPDPVKKER